MPAFNGRFGIVSQEGRGIKVGLLVACGYNQLGVLHGEEAMLTSNKLVRRIKGTHVICIPMLTGL